MNQTTTIDIICTNQIFPVTLIGTGIIEFEDRCLIERSDLVIQTFKSITTHLTGSFTPAFNITSLLPQHNGQLRLDHIQFEDDIELKELNEKVGELQRKTDQPVINMHDVHHYTMSYAIIGSAILIYFVYKHNHIILRVRRRKKTEANTES